MIQNPQIRSHDLHMTKHMIMVITMWLITCSKTPPDPDQSESPDHSLWKPLEPSRPCTRTIWHAHDIMCSKVHGPTHEPRARPFQNLPLLCSRLWTAEWYHCAVYCCTPKCSYWTQLWCHLVDLSHWLVSILYSSRWSNMYILPLLYINPAE